MKARVFSVVLMASLFCAGAQAAPSKQPDRGAGKARVSQVAPTSPSGAWSWMADIIKEILENRMN